MQRPANYRVGGWLTRDWEEVMEECGVGRGDVVKLVDAMRKLVEGLWYEMWKNRNMVVHGGDMEVVRWGGKAV